MTAAGLVALAAGAAPVAVDATPAAAATITPGWSQVAIDPSAREGAAMAYDPNTSKLVLFGGLDSSNSVLADTWTWNGTAWNQVATTGPPARDGAAMAYDPNTGQLVLFGGFSNSSSGDSLGDTWTWNGTAWNRVATTGPSARGAAAMAYDPTTRQLVLFGGYSNSAGSLGDTWTWNGTAWNQVATTGPPDRYVGSMAYDAATSQLILFGGISKSSGFLADTWTWNGTAWSQVATTGPPARGAAAMAYDPNTSKLLLFGGLDSSNSVLADTWTWGSTDGDLALSGVPSDMTVDATSPSGAVVNYTAPAAVDEDSPATASVSCSPASGSTFPIGTTTLTCTATDPDDTNSPVSASFTVTVQGILTQLGDLQAYVDGLGPGTDLAHEVQAVINYYQAGDVAGACIHQLRAVINTARAQSGKQLSTQQAEDILSAARQIGDVLGC